MLDSTLSRRRLLAGSAMLGASSLVFAACGGAGTADTGSMEEAKPAEPDTKEAAPAKEMASVNIVTFLKVPTELETDFKQNMAEPYIAENPGTTIELVSQVGGTADRVAKIKTMQAGGIPPDLSEFPRRAFAQVMQDLAQNMDDLVKARGLDLSVYNPNLLERDAMFQGQVYLLPMGHGGNAHVVMINPNYFEAAGLDYPSADVANSWTWDEWLEVMVKLRKFEGDKVSQWAMGNHAHDWCSWQLLWGDDCSWVSQDLTTATCDSEQMIDCYTSFFDLVHKHKVIPPQADRNNTYFGGQNPFLSGQVPLMISAPRSLPLTYADKALDQGVDFVMAPMPRVERSTPDANQHKLGLVYGSEKREAAFDYMVFLLDKGRLGKFVRRIPAWIPEIEPFIDEAFQGYSNPRISVAQDALATAVPQWNVGSLPTGGQVTTLLNDLGDKQLWTGNQDSATFLKEIQPTMQAIVDDGLKIIREKLGSWP